MKENIVLVNLRILSMCQTSGMSPRGSGQVKIRVDFGGSGRDKISFVYIERVHPFREEVPVDKFDEPQNRSSG